MKGQQGQQQPNSGLDIVYIAAFFMLIGIGVWYLYGQQIAEFILIVKAFQAQVIINVLTPVNNFLAALGFPQFDLDKATAALNEINNPNSDSTNTAVLIIISEFVGSYLVYPVVILGSLAGVHLLFFKKGTNFREKYSMQSLRNQEATNWPEITPILRSDLIKANLDDDPWGMSVQPLAFAKKHNLLKRVVIDHQPRVRLIKERAYSVFSNQLGRKWTNINGLKPYELALFAVCVARIGGEDKPTRDFLHQMSSSAIGGNPNYSGAMQLMRKHIQMKAISKAISPHAYVLTMMASLIQLARTNGVLACSEFLWLKAVDRKLWYMLSCVGRQTPFPEIAGAYGHWIIEKKLRRPLKSPMVEEAVIGLDTAINDILYNPDE